jgi:hypothetical protein
VGDVGVSDDLLQCKLRLRLIGMPYIDILLNLRVKHIPCACGMFFRGRAPDIVVAPTAVKAERSA